MNGNTVNNQSDSSARKYVFALDMGSESFTLALVSLGDNKITKAVTMPSPKMNFGAQAMMRVDFSSKDKTKEFRSRVLETINEMIKDIGVSPVEKMYVSGNANMIYSLFCIDDAYFGSESRIADYIENRMEYSGRIGLKGVKKILSLPSLSHQIGADVIASVYYLSTPTNKRYNLLLDLDTVPKVVLYSERGGICALPFVLPWFDNLYIDCAVSATKGSIYSFKLDNGKAEYKTIGNSEANGFCGIGLCDVIAELTRNRIIDEHGCLSSEYRVCDGVTISASDVKAFRLATFAVHLAIRTLMNEAKINFADISNFYICSNFSAKINVENASYVGLFPSELKNKAIIVKNSSLFGTVKKACEGGSLRCLAKRMKYIDLSENAYFKESFEAVLSIEEKHL